MTTPLDSESVEYNILLNAQQALKELQEFNRAAIDSAGKVESLEARIRNFERVVAEEAKKANVAFEQQLATFEKLDARLRQSKKPSLFGGTEASLGVDPFAETQIIHERRMAYEEQQSIAKAAFAEENALRNQEITGLTNATEAHKKLGNTAEETGKKSAQASKLTVGGIDLVHRALSILITSGIFAVIGAFTQLFAMAIKGLRELETATYNLVNAERTLSEQGVEITPKGLDETIKKLQELDPLLSKIQATELVSRTASLVAPAVGFNAEEVDQLSQAIAILAVRNKGLGKSFEEVESQVSNAFLSGRVSVGINQLGVKITDQIVKDEALRLGLVKTGDEFDNLTGKMEANIKARAMLSILTQNTAKEQQHLPEFLKTADAQFGIFQARLSDVATKIGTLLAPVLIKLFKIGIDGLEKLLAWMEKNEAALTIYGQALSLLASGFVYLVGFVMKFATAIGWGTQLLGYFIGRVNWLIERIPFLKKWIDSLSFKNIGDFPDTATSSVQEFGTTVESTASKVIEASAKIKDELADLAKDVKDKLADIEREYKEKLADISTEYGDKLTDINRKSQDKRLDALTDYNNKVADINRDAGQKQSDAQQEYRQKEIDRETEYQNKLKELRAKFLFDLEDALRERDARAVLRLMRQYQMDKKSLEEKNKLERQQNKVELQQKLQDIEIERQQKLEAARREYDDKLKEIAIGQQRELAELAIWKQRELRDAQIWHQRQLEEQRIYLQRKLRDIADAIAKEYQLTAAGAQAITTMLGSYFGSGSKLLSGFSSSLSGALGGSTSSGFGSTTPGFGTHTAGIGSGLYNPYDIRSRGGFAEGGTLLATRPTTVTFGETPEIATFTPITRAGQNVNDVFTSLGKGSGNVGGSASVILKVSPELKAEIVESSLETVALHLERIVRTE